jgi:hypothetical protein
MTASTSVSDPIGVSNCIIYELLTGPGVIALCIKVLYPADYILNKYFKGNTTTIPKLNWTDSYARRFSMSNTLFLYMQMLHLDIPLWNTFTWTIVTRSQIIPLNESYHIGSTEM